MNPTLSKNFADKRLKTSTQLVPGTVVTIEDVVSDTYGGNEFLVFKTKEFGETEGLAPSSLTKGRQGYYYSDEGTISEKRTMRYPQGTAVDAYKACLAKVQALAEADRTYGNLSNELKAVFVGKKIAITGNPYVDQYGSDKALRDFNFTTE